MPWCDECGREVDGDELVGGRCPTCGTGVVSASGADEVGEVDTAAEGAEEEEHARAPWHFKVLVVGTVVYLGYRLYQGIGWLIHHA